MSWADANAAFGVQWAGLVEEQKANPSHHPCWLLAATSAAGLADQVQVFVQVSADGRLLAAVPYYLERQRMYGVPVTVLKLATNVAAYHAEIVSRVPPEEMLVELLRSTPGWHVFHAAGLRPESESAGAIRAIADEMKCHVHEYPGENSPFLKIDSTWMDFVASKRKKDRYRIRHRKMLIANNPDAEYRWFQNPADVAGLLDDMMSIEQRSWKFGKHIHIERGGVEAAYHERLLEFLANQDALLACVLYIGGEPVSYSLCCNWNGWFGLLKTSYAASVRNIAPGTAVVDAVLERAFESGAYEFDFLGAADAYKLKWTRECRNHSDIFLFGPSVRTRMLSAGKRLKRALLRRGA